MVDSPSAITIPFSVELSTAGTDILTGALWRSENCAEDGGERASRARTVAPQFFALLPFSRRLQSAGDCIDF
jgi:hypothetical protein